MNAALIIARKDLRQRLRDKSALIFGIVAPLSLAFIFSMVFGPLDDPTATLADFAVVDEDGGSLAGAFVGTLEGMEDGGIVSLAEVDSQETARRMVEANSSVEMDAGETADAAFIIPEGFSEAVETGSETELLVLGSGASDFGVQIAHSVANGFAAEIGAVSLSVQTAIPRDAPPDPMMISGLVPLAAQTVSPIELEDVSARTKQLDYKTYLSAGMAIFFVFFTVQFGVSGLLEERHLGTMPRLLAAPIPRRSLLIGKGLTAFVLGVISMGVLAVGSTLLLGADWATRSVWLSSSSPRSSPRRGYWPSSRCSPRRRNRRAASGRSSR